MCNSKISILKQIFSYRAYQSVGMRSKSSCISQDGWHTLPKYLQWQLPSLKTRHLPLSSKNIANTISHQKIATIVRGCNGFIRYFKIASNNAKNMWKAMFELEKSKGHSILWSLVGIYKIRMFLEFEIIPTIVAGVTTIVVYQTATIWLGLWQLCPWLQ